MVWSRLWYHKFAEKYDIKQEYIFAGENKVKFNQFEDIKPESEKWVKNYIFQIEHELKVGIIGNRTEHFTKKNVREMVVSSPRKPSSKRSSMRAFSTRKRPSRSASSTESATSTKKSVRDYATIEDRYSTVPIRAINEPSKHWRQRLAEAF